MREVPPEAPPPRRWDQFPRWIAMSPDLKRLGVAEGRLLIWLSNKRDWDIARGDRAPWTNITALAEAIGVTRNSCRKAVLFLAAAGIVGVEKQGKRLRLRLFFEGPHGKPHMMPRGRQEGQGVDVQPKCPYKQPPPQERANIDQLPGRNEADNAQFLTGFEDAGLEAGDYER